MNAIAACVGFRSIASWGYQMTDWFARNDGQGNLAWEEHGGKRVSQARASQDLSEPSPWGSAF